MRLPGVASTTRTPMHRAQGVHRTIDVTMGLTQVTLRVPREVSNQFGLSWHQFVMGGTVEKSIRDGNDQLVMKDETKNMCRVTESIQKQHGKISKPTSHFTPSHNMVTIYHQDTVTGQDNDNLHLTDSHFSQDDKGCDNSRSFSHDTGSFSLSNTISSIDLTTWGPDVRRHNQSGRSMGSIDTTAVVTTRRGLARASQVWQDGRHDRTNNVLALHLSATEGSESICQMGKLHEMSAKTLDGEARLLEGGEGSTQESFGEGGNGQKDGGTEGQSFPIRSKTASATSPSSHSRTDERSAEKRSTEQERVRTWTDITNSHGSSEQQYQRSPRGSAQGTGTASRVPATHVGAAITDAASSSTAGVCSDGSHSTARGNATRSNGVDIRGDAAKDLARVVRDGSTPEGQRLREHLWVWLHLQDEEATEPVPKQLQSWLTGQKTQQRKEFKRNRRRHSS